MRIALFDTHSYERDDLLFLESRLTSRTAPLAKGCEVACSFVNDELDATALSALTAEGIRLIALRCAGYNHVDLQAAARLGLPVVRVPEYSPHAVAEHAVGLIIALNRKIYRAYNRVREGIFSLDGLVGFVLHGKTIEIVGTGRIGTVLSRIMFGFGCNLLAHDIAPNNVLRESFGVNYVHLSELYKKSDIVSLHVPLNSTTRHLIDTAVLAQTKPGVMLINASRGALEEGVLFQNLLEQVFETTCSLDC